jgi:hypothetical protein
MVKEICNNKTKMKKIKQIVETAFNKKDAIDMLETHRMFGNVNGEEYQRGRDMIRKEFN